MFKDTLKVVAAGIAFVSVVTATVVVTGVVTLPVVAVSTMGVLGGTIVIVGMNSIDTYKRLTQAQSMLRTVEELTGLVENKELLDEEFSVNHTPMLVTFVMLTIAAMAAVLAVSAGMPVMVMAIPLISGLIFGVYAVLVTTPSPIPDLSPK